MLIGSRHSTAATHDLQIFLDGNFLKQLNDFKYLGVHIEKNKQTNKQTNIFLKYHAGCIL